MIKIEGLQKSLDEIKKQSEDFINNCYNPAIKVIADKIYDQEKANYNAKVATILLKRWKRENDKENN